MPVVCELQHNSLICLIQHLHCPKNVYLVFLKELIQKSTDLNNFWFTES